MMVVVCSGPNVGSNVRACNRVGAEGIGGGRRKSKKGWRAGMTKRAKRENGDRAVPYIRGTGKQAYAH